MAKIQQNSRRQLYALTCGRFRYDGPSKGPLLFFLLSLVKTTLTVVSLGSPALLNRRSKAPRHEHCNTETDHADALPQPHESRETLSSQNKCASHATSLPSTLDPTIVYITASTFQFVSAHSSSGPIPATLHTSLFSRS